MIPRPHGAKVGKGERLCLQALVHNQENKLSLRSDLHSGTSSIHAGTTSRSATVLRLLYGIKIALHYTYLTSSLIIPFKIHKVCSNSNTLLQWRLLNIGHDHCCQISNYVFSVGVSQNTLLQIFLPGRSVRIENGVGRLLRANKQKQYGACIIPICWSAVLLHPLDWLHSMLVWHCTVCSFEHEGRPAEYWSLPKVTQKLLRHTFRSLKLMIVDEVSMISCLNLTI